MWMSTYRSLFRLLKHASCLPYFAVNLCDEFSVWCNFIPKIYNFLNSFNISLYYNLFFLTFVFGITIVFLTSKDSSAFVLTITTTELRREMG